MPKDRKVCDNNIHSTTDCEQKMMGDMSIFCTTFNASHQMKTKKHFQQFVFKALMHAYSLFFFLYLWAVWMWFSVILLKFFIFAFRLLCVSKQQIQRILHCFTLALWKLRNAINSCRLNKLDKFRSHPTIHKHIFRIVKEWKCTHFYRHHEFASFLFSPLFFSKNSWFFVVRIKSHVVEINCSQFDCFNHRINSGIFNKKLKNESRFFFWKRTKKTSIWLRSEYS